MALWRYSPRLWCPSRTHTCLRQLRSNRGAIRRIRCFSPSAYRSAQHRDDDESKCPPELSPQEWLRIQNYRRWKRLTEDPYFTLFGASNARLHGKGLRDWINKVMDELGLPKEPRYHSCKGGDSYRPKTTSEAPSRTHPPKTSSSDGDVVDTTKQSKGSVRTARFERDDTASGIESPSDPRRPRQQGASHDVGKDNLNASTTEKKAQSVSAVDDVSGQEGPVRPVTETPETAADTSVEDPQTDCPRTHWRQTALDRRLSGGSTTASENDHRPTLMESHRPEKFPAEKQKLPVQETVERSVPIDTATPDAADAKIANESAATQSGSNTMNKRSELLGKYEAASGQSSPGFVPTILPPHRAGILRKLPEDDIDLLTADDIRASMGRKTSPRSNAEAKRSSRADLEAGFKASHGRDSQLHPLVESKILNDQHIRRVKKDLSARSSIQRDASEPASRLTDCDENAKPNLGLRSEVNAGSTASTASTPSTKTSPDHVARSKDTETPHGLAQRTRRPKLSPESLSPSMQPEPEGPTKETDQPPAFSQAPPASTQTLAQEIGDMLYDSPAKDGDTLIQKDTTAVHNIPGSAGIRSGEDSADAPPSNSSATFDTASSRTRKDSAVAPSSTEVPLNTADQQASLKPENNSSTQENASSESGSKTDPTPSPMTYTILSYDPSSEEMHITSTSSPVSNPPSAVIPIHEALATLHAPAKFLPHLTKGAYEVVACSPNLLVLRKSSASASEILSSEILNGNQAEAKEEEWNRINPIDGTTRLSPTGFVGMDMDAGLRDEFDADARKKYYETWKVENAQRETRESDGARYPSEEAKGRKRDGFGGVVKTAIVAGSFCYVAGVIGELLR